MRSFSREEIEGFYRSRRARLAEKMKSDGISAAVFEDSEGRRNPAVRYFTGHPSDALYIIADDGTDFLIPWDENLAAQKAVGVKVVPYNDFGRRPVEAAAGILGSLKRKGTRRVEIPPETPYPLFLRYVDALAAEGWDVLCREKSTHDFVVEMRARKDEYEIECTREAARVGDAIIGEIGRGLREGWLKKEMDVALLIESELRRRGCERTGFDTLAAGPSRSWAIHAFPGYTDAPWPADGLSILDFGVVYEGYTSDTTLTVVRNATERQEELVSLVERAAEECLPLYAPDKEIRAAAARADDVFARAKRTMPHTLGHGIGLEIHEFPRVSAKMDADAKFQPGMVVTLEPGLYDPALGGVRLENDVLITGDGNEVLTHSRIIRI